MTTGPLIRRGRRTHPATPSGRSGPGRTLGERPDQLVLQGRGVLDRRAFGLGSRASVLGRTVQLHVAVRASRMAIGPGNERC